jgi:IS30 family transposase
MSRGKRFTEQELNYIKVHAQDMSIADIATALGRNYWAVQRVMQAKTAENLTIEQKVKIDNLKDEKTIYQIARELGVSYAAVNGYLSKRVNVTQNHMFTENDDFIIRQMYPRYRVSLIATKLGLTEEQVYNRAKRLGVRKNRTSRT